MYAMRSMVALARGGTLAAAGLKKATVAQRVLPMRAQFRTLALMRPSSDHGHQQSQRHYSTSAAYGAAVGEARKVNFIAISAGLLLAAPFLLSDLDAKTLWCDENPYEEFVAADVNELKDGQMKKVKFGENQILLSRVNGQYYATDGKCTHYGAPLETGVLVGERVTCPWHVATFNVKTGKLEDDGGPALDGLNTYEVKVKDGKVFVVAPKKAPPARGFKSDCQICTDKRTFVIVGGGGAGAVAAETLRQDGFKGRVIVITEEDSLAYDRTAVSKGANTEASKILLRDESFYKAHNIEVHRGKTVTEVSLKDNRIVFADGSAVNYDSVLLATGATPRTLPVPGAGLSNIFTLRNPKDNLAISQATAAAKNIVIVGGSFIGLEAASMIKKANPSVNVTVVDVTKVPLERVLGSAVGGAVKKLHEANGVKFEFGKTVSKFEGDGKVKEVFLNDGTKLNADVVVLGVGVAPATKPFKDAPRARDGGVLVDSNLRIKDSKNAFAAGDIATFPYHGEDVRIEHWQVAQNQGRIAAHNMLNQQVKSDFVPFFWTRSWDNSLAYVGHAHPDRVKDVIVHGDLDKRQFVAYYTDKNQVLAVAAMGVPKVAAAASELMRTNKMPTPDQVRKNPDLVKLLETI